MKNSFYFKSLNSNQEKEVMKALQLATAKIADGVINNDYPFYMTDSSLSVYDSKSEEIYFSYDRLTDSVTYIGSVKAVKRPIKFADAKSTIELISTDKKTRVPYNVDLSNKEQLNKVYLDLVNKSKEQGYADKEFSLMINGKVPYEFENKPLYNIYPKFKDEIDDIIMEASKESFLKQGRKNEFGVMTKVVNRCIAQLAEKLKANKLFNCEEFTALVTALKQGKMTEQDFTTNCDNLIKEFKVRNDQFDQLLTTLKNSEEYKSVADNKDLNNKLDSLNLRRKYVYDKESEDSIKTDFFAVIAEYVINSAQEKGVDKESIEKNKSKLIYTYLKGKGIIIGLDTDKKPIYNTDEFSESIIKDIKKLVENYKDFDSFKSAVEEILRVKKTKENSDIEEMNKWIEQNFKYTKLPEQLNKVKKEVEKHKLTYQDFLNAYYAWARDKYWNKNPENYKNSKYYVWFTLYQDSTFKKPLVLAKYKSHIDYSVPLKYKEINQSDNAIMVKGNENSVIANFKKDINNIAEAIKSRYEDKYTIKGILLRLSTSIEDQTPDNTVDKAVSNEESFSATLQEAVRFLNENIHGLVDEDETEDYSDVEVVEED